MEENKSKRGGKREGAGRKKGVPSTIMSFKCDNYLLEIMRQHVDNKSLYINKALREALIKDGVI
jgi:hypothetical protein